MPHCKRLRILTILSISSRPSSLIVMVDFYFLPSSPPSSFAFYLMNFREFINVVFMYCLLQEWCKGETLIDDVPETLDMLRSKGKRLVFVTNNSTKFQTQYGKKFEILGLNVREIFASSFAAAVYLKLIDFPKDKKVRILKPLPKLTIPWH
ncbi:hypothetical protein M5K25_000172 [Dendrobium thyrsiflorum]|uniref:Phosphoglycolate phosphatase n=1 Tax=Dendrobium thyrsiflorum TaxID=117978 RepID=A0ABD0VSW8_DENTH